MVEIVNAGTLRELTLHVRTLIVKYIVSAPVDATSYKPIQSSCTASVSLTHLRHITTCSIFAASVVSSTITEKNGAR